MTESDPQQPAPYGQQPEPYGQQPAPYGQQPYGQQPYGQQPQQSYQGATVQDPGKTMAIIAVVLPFIGFGLVGLILGIIAKSKSKKAGFKNTIALVAIIISSLAIVVSIIFAIVIGVYFADVAAQINEQCGPGGSRTFTFNGQTGTCPTTP